MLNFAIGRLTFGKYHEAMDDMLFYVGWFADQRLLAIQNQKVPFASTSFLPLEALVMLTEVVASFVLLGLHDICYVTSCSVDVLEGFGQGAGDGSHSASVIMRHWMEQVISM